VGPLFPGARAHFSLANTNVIYWVDSAQFHGDSMSTQPFSYCEINDELTMDGCNLLPVIE